MDSNQHGGIDLHIHTTASDGTYEPHEILQMASRLGLQAIAITDHDTLEGSRRALAGEIPAGLDFLSGVEISAHPPDRCKINGSLHILAYDFDVDSRPLQKALGDLQQARGLRTRQIVERLHELGIPLSLEQVLKEAGPGNSGRPHVASAMVKAGVVQDIDEAFGRYLGKGCPAYVDKYRLNCRQAFELIRNAGGIPVLAHPYLIRCGHGANLTDLVRQLCAWGLMGLEAYYPEHTPKATDEYLHLAQTYNLLVTGGTDFHGRLTPDIQMGRGRGGMHIPYTVYEALVARRPQTV